MSEPVLCFIYGPWAYFTTQSLAEQWGDDWNDAPYEHNAGEPYTYDPSSDGVGCVCVERNGGRRLHGPRGCGMPGHVPSMPKKPWGIIKVAWDAPLSPPSAGVANSNYSVEQINRGDVAWLRPDRYAEPREARPIPAGATLSEFRRLIRLAGGRVYESTTADGRTLPEVMATAVLAGDQDASAQALADWLQELRAEAASVAEIR